MRLTLASTLVLAALAAAGPSAGDPATAFLTNALGLSSAELGRLVRGEVVSRTLDVAHRREVATLGVIRIRTSPEAYVARMSDIKKFKQTPDVLQIGTFSAVPAAADLKALTIDEADIKELRTCRVDDCGVQLPAGAIERVRREIDWRAPDAAAQAGRLVRQVLADYVGRYTRGGAAMEYADRTPRLDVPREFASLLAADSLLSVYAPRLHRYLLDDPASPAEEITGFVYWSKELVRSRPVISMTHVAIAPAVGRSPIAYAIASKQIYAMHYFDASLGLTLLVPDRGAASPATYVVYLNRTRIDLFDGLFGGLIRRIVAGRARTLVGEQLQRLQRELGPGAAR